MRSDDALNMLLWSYMKIGESEDVDYVLSKAFEFAYKDATAQGAFNTRVNSSTRQYVLEAKDNASECLVNSFEYMRNRGFDGWHRAVCGSVVSCFDRVNDEKNKKAFTIGNAQKLVNMFIKYLYIIAGSNPSFFDSWYKTHLLKFEPAFHAPVDNYILQNLYMNGINNWCKNVRIKPYGENNEIYANQYYISFNDGKDFCVWSRISNYDDYLKIQEYIEDMIGDNMRLNWENMAWIEVAQLRRNGNLK